MPCSRRSLRFSLVPFVHGRDRESLGCLSERWEGNIEGTLLNEMNWTRDCEDRVDRLHAVSIAGIVLFFFISLKVKIERRQKEAAANVVSSLVVCTFFC